MLDGLARHEVTASTASETADSPIAPKPKPAYSEVLCRYIAHHKSMAVQHLLLANPRKAREVAVLLLLGASDQGPSVSLSRHDCLSTFAQADEPPASYQDVTQQAKRFAAALGLTEEDEEDAGWQQLRCARRDATTLYEAVQALSDADLDRLHLLLTVLCFGQGDINRLDTADTLFNRVARDLGADMRAYWQPDASFLSRRNRTQLVQIVDESGLFDRLPDARSMKKAELVRALERQFARVRELEHPTDADTKARDWLPDTMRFPAGEPVPQEAHTPQDADPAEGRSVLRCAA